MTDRTNADLKQNPANPANPSHPPLTPELDKQREAIHEGHAHELGAFLDWLEAAGYVLAKWSEPEDELDDPELYDPYVGKERLLAEHFGIDLSKIEAEKRALLDHIRAQQ